MIEIRELVVCPVDGCDWQLDLPDMPSRMESVREAARVTASLDDAVRKHVLTSAQATEEVIREHLETHDVIDFVRTIHRLRQQAEGDRDSRSPGFFASAPGDGRS